MCLEKRKGGHFIGLKREAIPTSNRCGIANLAKGNMQLDHFCSITPLILCWDLLYSTYLLLEALVAVTC